MTKCFHRRSPLLSFALVMLASCGWVGCNSGLKTSAAFNSACGEASQANVLCAAAAGLAAAPTGLSATAGDQ